MNQWISTQLRSQAFYRWLQGGIIALMLAVSGLGLLALSRHEERMTATAGAALGLTASDMARAIDRFWYQLEEDAQALASTLGPGALDLRASAESLASLREASTIPRWIGVTDAQGRVLAATDAASVGQHDAGVEGFDVARAAKRSRVFVGRPASSGETPDGAEIGFAVPLSGKRGGFEGWVVMRLEPAAVDEQIRKAVEAAESRLAFVKETSRRLAYEVMTPEGLALLDSEPERQGRILAEALPILATGPGEPGGPEGRWGPGGQQGYIEHLHWNSRAPIVLGYAATAGPVGSTDAQWVALVWADRDLIVSPARLLGWQVGLAWSLIGLPGLGLLLWATGRLQRGHAQFHEESLRANKAEQSLSEREERTQMILDTALDALISIDQEGRIIDWNRQAVLIFGWSREEAIGRKLSNTIIPPQYQALLERGLRQFLDTGEASMLNRRVEVTACRRDGQEFPVELAVSPAKIGGQFVLSAFVRDITERKLRERRVAVQDTVTRVLSEGTTVAEAGTRLLQTLCESLEWELGALWLLDDHAQVLRLAEIRNRRAIGRAEFVKVCKRLEVRRGTGLPGRVWARGEPIWVQDVMRDPDLPRAEAAAMTGLHSAFAFPVRAGETVYGVLEFFSYSISAPSQDLLDMVSDIGLKVGQFVERKRAESALRETEELLRQSQKMEAIGRLAGGVAHDFNNLLTVISGYTELLLAQLGPQDHMRAEVEEIGRAGARAAALTGQLLAFSRRQARAPQMVDLNAVVVNMEHMLRRLLGEDIIDLTTVREPDLGKIEADAAHLDQVLMNLAVNARDAMPTGGKLTIETANVTVQSDAARRPGSVDPGDYVVLTITDTGYGMNEETLAQLFEPFFTTKDKGKGTGLGLSTVYGIVRQNGGHIEVQSQLGQGSTFKIYFPRLEREEHHQGGETPVSATKNTGETILVVEDEPGVRGLVRDMLRHRGYTVLEARDGINAQLVSKGHFGRIDLLLTDVVMPQKSGPEAAKELLDERPEMRVLYMSGYADHPLFSQGPLDKGKLLLQKPFTPGALVHKVREVLDMPIQDFKKSHLVS